MSKTKRRTIGTTYQWVPSARIGGDPQKIGEEISRLEARDGVCAPEAFVAAATRETHPAHDRFEWDDAVAGHKFRVEQARHIIRSVRPVVEDRPSSAPAFVHVTVVTDTGVASGYRSTERALEDPATREQVLRDAVRQAEGLLRRHESLEELSPIRRALEEVKSTLAA